MSGAWETLPGLETFRGRGRYRRAFQLRRGGTIALAFGGVSHTATVRVDGLEVGHHHDAYTPWEVVVPGLAAGRHDLEVDVDNTFGEVSALHRENDYYTYGGITRPVELHLLPDLYLERVFATPVAIGDGWALDVRVRVRNVSRAASTRAVRVAVAGTTSVLGAIAVGPLGSAELSGRVPVKGVTAWCAATPSLYDLVVELLEGSDVVDDQIDRIGFREVAIRGRALLLNGRPLRLRGYNRHEDHPQFGNALPLEAMATDLHLLGDLGCNFVRTSQYPNDLRFLDLCDELGFYVWEESHARSVDFDHPRFDEQIEASTREMVEWHRNRPSVLLWGCLNECDSESVRGQDVYGRVLGQLKELDPSRPTTYASHHRTADRCWRFADVVSLNLYVGWTQEPLDQVETVLDGLLEWLHSDASDGARDKPVLVSEFGAAALYGSRQPRGTHWSEEYQARVLDECLRVYLNHPSVCGAAIWQVPDCRVTEGEWRWRPRTSNDKGTVDEYRRPKLAYATVAARMREAAARWDVRGDSA